MLRVTVSQKELDKIVECIQGDYTQGMWEAAIDAGWPGFQGGIDHYVIEKHRVLIYDRGCNGKSNDVKFVVPVAERR